MMEFKCNCQNSGTSSFTGRCDRCGMIKPSQGTTLTNNSLSPYKKMYENKNDLEQFCKSLDELQNIKRKIINLQRYDSHNYLGIVMRDKGKYIKIEDVLNLFSAKINKNL